MIDLIRKQFPDCRAWKWPLEYLDSVYLDLDHLMPSYGAWHIDQQTALQRLKRAKCPVVKTHLLPGFTELSQNSEFVQSLWSKSKPIYMVRDGRDVLCSAHLWMQEFKPATRCPIAEFIRQEEHGMNRVEIWSSHVNAWLNQNKVLVIKYEDVIKQTAQVINQISAHLGLSPVYRQPLLPKRFKGKWHRRFERLVAIQPETTAVLGRFDGKKPLKWQQAFTEVDKRFFDHYSGNLLTKLGYESTNEWVLVK